MTTSDIPIIAFTVLHQKLAAVLPGASAFSELCLLREALRDEQPSLRKKSQSGDAQAAAQLAVNDLRLGETIPSELVKLAASQREPLTALWSELHFVWQKCHAVPTEILERKGREINAAVRAVLAPLLNTGASYNLGDLASLTKEGLPARKLLAAMAAIEADHPRDTRFRRSPDTNYDLNFFVEFQSIVVRKAQSLIACWTVFQRAGAE